jgi:hypothetical protein
MDDQQEIKTDDNPACTWYHITRRISDVGLRDSSFLPIKVKATRPFDIFQRDAIHAHPLCVDVWVKKDNVCIFNAFCRVLTRARKGNSYR